MTTGLLGFDAQWKRLLAGVLLSHSEGDGAYRLSGGADKGAMRASLTGVYPYARYLLGSRVSVWAVAGAGSGSLELAWEEDTMRTDLALELGALGVMKGDLLESAALDLALKSDAMWIGTSSDAADGMAGADTRVTRVRLALKGSRTFALAPKSTLTPSVQVGLRHDGGDAEKGTGVEVTAGARYHASILTVEFQARMLLAHEAAGYDEWGVSGAVRLSPRPSGLGPSVALVPSWGLASGGIDRLWAHPDASSLARSGAAESATGRLDAEVGWGFAALGGNGILTPYARAALAETESRSWHLGARLALAESLDLSLEGSRRRHAGGVAAHDVALRASLPW